jgi:hypothetical protein
MSIQPRLERFKNIQLTNRELIWMLVGFAAGLLLGLLISWAWWPVEAGTSVTTSVAVSTPPVSTPETTSNDGNGANSLLIVFGVLLAFIGGGAIAWLYQQGAFGGGSAQTAVVGPLEQGGVEAREKETVARSELEVDDVRSSFGSSSARSGISGHETVRAVSSVVPPTRPPATAASVAPFEEEEEGLPSPFSGASASMRSTSQSIAPSVAAFRRRRAAIGFAGNQRAGDAVCCRLACRNISQRAISND